LLPSERLTLDQAAGGTQQERAYGDQVGALLDDCRGDPVGRPRRHLGVAQTGHGAIGKGVGLEDAV
jgi:hypothetical protein